MDTARWHKLQDLFTAVHAVEGDERERLLREHALSDPELVSHVRSLLIADARPGIMDALAPQFVSVARMLDDASPDRIGAYRVVREIGRGGMGVVYLADRADGGFDQRVAIKLIGPASAEDPLHQRFLAERQILAGLTHPNIARLLDGGVTPDGRPYLVMELVDGVPITTYCDSQRLDLRARLRLFADVCAAVQHAHQNLVIHRDLKPTNILVSTDGRAHLLDFGIAKLIDPAAGAAQTPLTRIDSRMMTPEYASPEQVRGDVLTTASDIYSLGVLLYELLCGHRPYKLTTESPLAIATAVSEQEPERPSVRVSGVDSADPPQTIAQLRGTSIERLARSLDGDLDGIVLMAMRKEASHRYASVDMLRQDIERYLAGLPVLAHRGGRRYRVAKLLRRHRVEATAAALVLAALVTGLSVALAQGRRASRERDRAEQALAESTAVSRFLLELFRTGDARSVPATELSALDLLQRGALRANELSNQPIVHARLLDVIGQMSYHLGRLDEAQRWLEQAATIQRGIPGDRSVDLASSLIHLAWVHRTRNERDTALKLVSEALDLRRKALPPDHADIAEALYELGWLTFGREQEGLYRQALAVLGETSSAAQQRVTVLQALATNLRRQGRFTETVVAGRDALAAAERWFGPDHHVTGYAMIHLADHVADLEQDVVGAERLYRRGLEMMTRHLGENSVRLLHGLNSLASLLSSRGDAGAEPLYRRALEISHSATGREHLRVADQMHKLATELLRQGRLSEAESLTREALDLSIRTSGPRHHAVTTSRMPLLAKIFDAQRRYDEADEMFQSAIGQVESHLIVGEMRRDYGRTLLRRGDLTRAEEQLLQSLALLEQVYVDGVHPNLQESKRALMELYQQLGKPELVERYRVPPGRFSPH